MYAYGPDVCRNCGTSSCPASENVRPRIENAAHWKSVSDKSKPATPTPDTHSGGRDASCVDARGAQIENPTPRPRRFVTSPADRVKVRIAPAIIHKKTTTGRICRIRVRGSTAD